MHPIERRANDNGKIKHASAKNYLRFAMLRFTGFLIPAAIGAVVALDYATGWPETCGGNPMPVWPAIAGWAVMGIFGFFAVKQFLSITTAFDPFADKVVMLEVQAKQTAAPESPMRESVDAYKKRTAKTEPETEGTVIEGSWEIPGSEMPA